MLARISLGGTSIKSEMMGFQTWFGNNALSTKSFTEELKIKLLRELKISVNFFLFIRNLLHSRSMFINFYLDKPKETSCKITNKKKGKINCFTNFYLRNVLYNLRESLTKKIIAHPWSTQAKSLTKFLEFNHLIFVEEEEEEKLSLFL